MGYCGLDRTRQPISGDEIRACWESRPEQHDITAAPPVPALGRTPVPHRDFIEVVEAAAAVTVTASTRRTRRAPESAEVGPEVAPSVAGPRWSLWEDAEV